MKKVTMIMVLILLLNCGSRKVATEKQEVKQEVKIEQTTKQEVANVVKVDGKTETNQEEQKENKEVEAQVKTIYKKVYYPSGVLKSETAISENNQKMKLEISNIKKQLKNETRKVDSLTVQSKEDKATISELTFKDKTKVTESTRPSWQIWGLIFLLICALVFVIYQEFLKKIRF